MSGETKAEQPLPVPKPLPVVAGLSRPTADTIAGTIENLRPVNVVSVQFGKAGPVAYDEAPIWTLLERACGFALRDRAGAAVSPIPDPSSLLLAYVEAPGWERLIDAFGVSAMPLPMKVDDWEFDGGREWRALIEPLKEAVCAALDLVGRPPRRAIRQRLESRSAKELLALPLRNFETERGALLQDVLEAMSDPDRWAAVGAGIETPRFTSEVLRRFHKRTGGANRRFPMDARGLVFANASGGRHAPVRALPAEPRPTVPQLRMLLESMYRLGTPLPDGFQHDVQWPEDAFLAKERFSCSQEGAVDLWGTHANIYPDDYVREAGGGEKRPAEV